MESLYTLIDRTIQEKGYGFDDINYIDDIDEIIIELLNKIDYEESFFGVCQKLVVNMKDRGFFDFSDDYSFTPPPKISIQNTDKLKQFVTRILNEPKDMI